MELNKVLVEFFERYCQIIHYRLVRIRFGRCRPGRNNLPQQLEEQGLVYFLYVLVKLVFELHRGHLPRININLQIGIGRQNERCFQELLQVFPHAHYQPLALLNIFLLEKLYSADKLLLRRGKWYGHQAARLTFKDGVEILHIQKAGH